MNLKSSPPISDKIYLAEISTDFASLEGDTPRDGRIWVIVRQGTEEDNRRRASLLTERERKWNYSTDGLDSISDVTRENPYARRALEVYLTLHEIGNDEGATFKCPTKTAMSMNDFDKAWGQLNPIVARAIHEAVLTINPDWRIGVPNW